MMDLESIRPPHDPLRESAALFEILYGEHQQELVNTLSEDVFYSTLNRSVFRECKALVEEKGGIDYVELVDRLVKNRSESHRKMFMNQILSYVEAGVLGSSVKNIADELIDLKQRRDVFYAIFENLSALCDPSASRPEYLEPLFSQSITPQAKDLSRYDAISIEEVNTALEGSIEVLITEEFNRLSEEGYRSFESPEYLRSYVKSFMSQPLRALEVQMPAIFEKATEGLENLPATPEPVEEKPFVNPSPLPRQVRQRVGVR